MALDAVVLDVLKSLEIAPLPPQVNAGVRVDLGLTPPGLNAFDLLFEPPTLFDIELNNITLDNIAIDLTDISLRPVGAPGQEGFQLTLDAPPVAPGTTDLELVSKAVEFPPLDPPTGTTTTGRITGKVGQVEKFSGGITGNIGGHIKGRITGTINNLKGSVKAPQLSKSRPKPSVKWYIKDENGIEKTDFVLLNKTLEDPAPSLMFLPVFAELSAGVDLNSHRRISCEVTVTVGTETSEPHILGPIDILVPKIPLPTVLVMTLHSVGGVDYPGAVLVAVPSQSLLTLDQLTSKLQKVEEGLDRLKTFTQLAGLADFTDTIKQINQIITLIGKARIRIPFVEADEVRDLRSVMREPGFWGDLSWNDCISSLVMIGPPGRSARFYHMTELRESEGAFQITLGRKGVGHIDTLSSSILGCKPDDRDGCTFKLRATPLDLTFSDKISSYQFLPLQ